MKKKENKKPDYESAYHLLMCYFGSIHDSEKPKVDKQLKELGL